MSHTWKRRLIGLGGTFDHLHDGHKAFLAFAFKQGGFLKIGLTTDQMISHKPFSSSLQPFKARKKALISYCKKENIPCEIVPLNDPFGPAVSDSKMFGLALTPPTIRNGQKINEFREKLNLRPLETYVCQLVHDHKGQPINSSRIRSGQINRQGQYWSDLLAETITLNSTQKSFFQQKQGEIVTKPNPHPNQLKLVVGDSSLETFIDNEWEFNLGVYDLKRNRQPATSNTIEALHPIKVLENQPGQINATVSHFLKSILDKLQLDDSHIIQINGEEDLVAVNLALLSPLGTAIYYGQPNDGMVEMIVTEELKAKIAAVLA